LQAFDFGNNQSLNICAISYYFSETCLFYRMYTANWQYLTVGVSAPSNPLVYSSAADWGNQQEVTHWRSRNST